MFLLLITNSKWTSSKFIYVYTHGRESANGAHYQTEFKALILFLVIADACDHHIVGNPYLIQASVFSPPIFIEQEPQIPGITHKKDGRYNEGIVLEFKLHRV